MKTVPHDLDATMFQRRAVFYHVTGHQSRKKYYMWESAKLSCLHVVEMSVVNVARRLWIERGNPSESGAIEADVSSVSD
jgi:hypothetical protein